MEKLQNNKPKLAFPSKKCFRIPLFCYLIISCLNSISQPEGVFVDRFYKTVDSILECKKTYNFPDTISFIQKELYSYRNNAVYFYFNSFLKCHDINYVNNLKEEGVVPTINITSTYGMCDKKYILLFYIENYLLGNILKKTSLPKNIDVYTPISLKNKKSGKFTIMGKKIIKNK